MDKDSIAVEYTKIYFSSHPEAVPEDTDKAYEVISKVHKKYKSKILGALKDKSERFVDNYFENKDDKYL